MVFIFRCACHIPFFENRLNEKRPGKIKNVSAYQQIDKKRYQKKVHKPLMPDNGFHFHFEFHPPLRKPNLLKYLAGPEIGGGNFLSDTSPEEKAEELRQQSEVHYKLQAD